MRSAFTIEDQDVSVGWRCQRINEMYASSLVAPGNHAENVLQEKQAEYNEEINRSKYQAEAYIGNQSEDIER